MERQHEDSYIKALNEVLKIRKDRKIVYGDGWKSDPDWLIFANMFNKMLRLKTFIIDKNTNFSYENETDTIRDLINYSLFLLANKIDKKQND